MMIPAALHLSRYRAFKDELRFDLSPLTIIIGKNGSGKSVLTRLPLLISGGLSSRASSPLDLGAGGVEHAARYEDLIYQRSAQPFSIGATIRDATGSLTFRTTLRYVVERHSLAIEAFELEGTDQPRIKLDIANPESIADKNSPFSVSVDGRSVRPNAEPMFVGLFPNSIKEEASLSDNLNVRRTQFEQAFERPAYLGPFRSETGYLPRVPRQGVTELGPRGERALDMLGNDALRGEGQLVTKVEDWFEKSMGGVRIKLDKAGDLPRLKAYDPIRQIDVDLAETGVGFAQVLPIAVQNFALQSRLMSSSIAIVEQPELHLHPGAHGDIADLLISTVCPRPSELVYLCETHSEQVIARLRRRVAEGVLQPELIQIASVGHKNSVDAAIEPLRMLTIDGSGNLNAWPIGVFDEAFDDLLHLRAAARDEEMPK